MPADHMEEPNRALQLQWYCMPRREVRSWHTRKQNPTESPVWYQSHRVCPCRHKRSERAQEQGWLQQEWREAVRRWRNQTVQGEASQHPGSKSRKETQILRWRLWRWKTWKRWSWSASQTTRPWSLCRAKCNKRKHKPRHLNRRRLVSINRWQQNLQEQEGQHCTWWSSLWQHNYQVQPYRGVKRRRHLRSWRRRSSRDWLELDPEEQWRHSHGQFQGAHSEEHHLQ